MKDQQPFRGFYANPFCGPSLADLLQALTCSALLGLVGNLSSLALFLQPILPCLLPHCVKTNFYDKFPVSLYWVFKLPWLNSYWDCEEEAVDRWTEEGRRDCKTLCRRDNWKPLASSRNCSWNTMVSWLNSIKENIPCFILFSAIYCVPFDKSF